MFLKQLIFNIKSNKTRKIIFSFWFILLFLERVLWFIFKTDKFKKFLINLRCLNFRVFKVYLYDEFSITAIWNTIFYDEYWFNKISKYFNNNKKITIINIWTNIWDFILFSKLYFNNSEIFWYEINNKIINILKKNISKNNLKDINIYNYWISITSWEYLIDNNNHSWSNKISKEWNILVKCIWLSELNYNNIDILQMDIEWEEFNIFENEENLLFLKKVWFFMIEHHDIKKWHILRKKIEDIWFKVFYISENNPYTFIFINLKYDF